VLFLQGTHDAGRARTAVPCAQQPRSAAALSRCGSFVSRRGQHRSHGRAGPQRNARCACRL